MKKILIAIVAIAATLLAGCASINVAREDNNKIFSKENPTVVIITLDNGVALEQMKTLQDSLPGSVVIVCKKLFPPQRTFKEVMEQLKEKEINGSWILIGYSRLGYVARVIDIKNPGRVAAIVTIGTALGKFRFTPEFVSDIFFRPDDDCSQTPLFVVGGISKELHEKHWWIINNNQTDGLVDIDSVMDTGKRKIAGKAVFEGDQHHELLKDQKFIIQIQTWLKPWLKPEEEK